nr:MAG TPA: hypothetical protein [Crassvirales sp.]
MKDFGIINAGELGGWIEKEENLSQYGNAWVYDDSMVYDNAIVSDNAWVYSNAKVYDNANVSDNAIIRDHARVFGNAFVSDNADIFHYAMICGYVKVCGNAEIRNAKVYDNKDYIVFKNFWSSGIYFTWTRSNNKWSAGYFHGTGEELIKKAYADSEKSGKEYERVVKYVESILADEQKEKVTEVICDKDLGGKQHDYSEFTIVKRIKIC